MAKAKTTIKQSTITRRMLRRITTLGRSRDKQKQRGHQAELDAGKKGRAAGIEWVTTDADLQAVGDVFDHRVEYRLETTISVDGPALQRFTTPEDGTPFDLVAAMESHGEQSPEWELAFVLGVVDSWEVVRDRV